MTLKLNEILQRDLRHTHRCYHLSNQHRVAATPVLSPHAGVLDGIVCEIGRITRDQRAVFVIAEDNLKAARQSPK